MIDERPDEIKQLEAFGTGKWKVIGGKTKTCILSEFLYLLVVVCLKKMSMFVYLWCFFLLSINKSSGFNGTKCIMNSKIVQNSVFDTLPLKGLSLISFYNVYLFCFFGDRIYYISSIMKQCLMRENKKQNKSTQQQSPTHNINK